VNQLQLTTIESVSELRAQAAGWDDLWWRSEAYLPTLRAEPLAQWLERFAPQARFLALTVSDEGRLLAALPLVETVKAGFLRVAALPGNCWSSSGDLLLDAEADAESPVSLLVDGLKRLPWPLVWLDEVEIDSARWQAFCSALSRAGRIREQHAQYCGGLIDIDHDWEGYQASWSQNHRHAVRKSKRRLEQAGSVQLLRHAPPDAESLPDLLRKAFEIENLSWKGEAGTSVLKTPGMFEFFLQQARQLSAWGQLELFFLEHAGRPLAFEYCYVAKGAVGSHKIGYDPAWGKHGPGRLLRFLQLQEYYRDPECRLFDTLGILDDSKARWCTRAGRVGRIVTTGGGTLAVPLAAAYRHLRPRLSRLRGTPATIEPPKLGAASRDGKTGVLAQTGVG